MWTRKDLKDKAKQVLRKNYLKAFCVSIIIALAGGNNGWGDFSHHFKSSKNYSYSHINNNSFIPWDLIFTTLTVFAAISVVLFLLRIFIGYSLEVGGTRYFVQSAQFNDNKRFLGFGFNVKNYMGILKTMLLTDIFIFLWSLLLIIPGIVKSYSYQMVPYILADNPNIGVKKAIALSNEMTMGHKWDMFVLDLSFIGWYLLGILAFGIGILFVLPYENATDTELYLVLRKDALENKLCSYEDLSLTAPILDDNNNI